ncbi:MAG: LysM peptidoglycan-binding domain-containing protein [Pseudoclavibacter sp.]
MTIAIAPPRYLATALRSVASRLADLARAGRSAASSAELAAADTVSASAAATPAPRTYRVKPGDTAASIAIAHGLSAASLLVRNGMRLREEPEPGALLVVERGGAGCREARPVEPVEVTHHEIQSGETLDDLCFRFSVSRRVLLTANGLAAEASITPGVVLVIPSSTDPRDTGEVPITSRNQGTSEATEERAGGTRGVSGRKA